MRYWPNCEILSPNFSIRDDHNTRLRASEVAYAIGHESASQFSREYLRQFGAPPARDVRQIRAAIGSPGKA